jgi:hypothetical protein
LHTSTASPSAGARSSPPSACRVPWEGRSEDKTDDSVWAATCFVTRTGFRRRGVSALAREAVDFARERGARALEGYPMLTEAGKEITWGELHVGSRSIFAVAGFAEVSRPSRRRVVMRIDVEARFALAAVQVAAMVDQRNAPRCLGSARGTIARDLDALRLRLPLWPTKPARP